MSISLSPTGIEAPARLCGGCGFPTPRSWRFCRACGWDATGDSELDQHLVLPSPEVDTTLPPVVESAGSCLGSIFRWGIYATIVLILLAIAIPPRRSHRPHSREKACYANMRVILGAIEMYNMDHSIMARTISDADVDTNGFLVRGQYLKSRVTKPETTCSYSSTGDLTGDGKIICALHGTVEE